MQVSKQQLATLSIDELQQVIRWANGYIDNRVEQRKKELWGNVMAAIVKYEQEIDSIAFYCHQCGSEYTIDEMKKDTPGYIYIS